MGRRRVTPGGLAHAVSMLEAHHAATKYWSKQLGVPADKLDDMPAVLFNKYFHQYNSNLPEHSALHKILDQNMKGVDGRDRTEVLKRLKKTYRDFEGLDDPDPDPDIWIVTKAWLDRHMTQP